MFARSVGKVTEPDDEKALDGITDEDILDYIVDVSNTRNQESYFNQPLKMLPLIEGVVRVECKELIVNDAHHCLHDNNCQLIPLAAQLFRLFLGGKETIHICLPLWCRHRAPDHVCTSPETCPHRFEYPAHDVYTYKALFMCDRIGRVHLCGIHCRSGFTDTVKGGLHTCPLTGIVLHSQLAGPLDNYQKQIVGGDGDDDGDDDHTLALEDTPTAPKTLALTAPRSRQGVAMLLLKGTGENATDELMEEKQRQIRTWTTTAFNVIVDLMTKTSVPAAQVLAPVTELLAMFRSKKYVSSVENGETSIIELIAKLHKMMPRPDKIHPVWKNPRQGENPLHFKLPVNKDNIRRWRRIREIWCPIRENTLHAFESAQMQHFEKIAGAAVESFTSYVNMCIRHNVTVQYSFEHFLPYILYQMQDGLSVSLYTPTVGVTHTEVPTVCIVPKIDVMQFLPQVSALPKYKSLKQFNINVRILSRMQKVKTYLVQLYNGSL